MYRSHVLVCGGTGCTSSGSEQIIQTLKDELKKNRLQNEVAVVKTGCHGAVCRRTGYDRLSGSRILFQSTS